MADEGSEDTFEYELAGRTIVFYKTTRPQLQMLQRLLRRIQTQMADVADEPEKLADLLTQLNDLTFEAVESRFVNPLDLMFVEKEIIRGNITEQQLNGILTNGKQTAPELADDLDPPAPKRAAKKAAVKKAVKKAPGRPRGTR